MKRYIVQGRLGDKITLIQDDWTKDLLTMNDCLELLNFYSEVIFEDLENMQVDPKGFYNLLQLMREHDLTWSTVYEFMESKRRY